MVEFGLPAGVWKRPWELYAGWALPFAGRLINPGWYEVGRFLRGSIEDFHRRFPDPTRIWHEAGLSEIQVRKLSLGGGLVMWARKP